MSEFFPIFTSAEIAYRRANQGSYTSQNGEAEILRLPSRLQRGSVHRQGMNLVRSVSLLVPPIILSQSRLVLLTIFLLHKYTPAN